MDNRSKKAHEYYVNNKDAVNAKAKLYRESHKEQIANKKREYAIKNADKLKEHKHQYYENNKERILQKTTAYYHAHKNTIVANKNINTTVDV